VPHVELVESVEATRVYLEQGCHEFVLKQAEQLLECGDQRARLASQVAAAFNSIGRGVVMTSNKAWQGQLKVGDQLRLLMPKMKVIRAPLVALEHISTGESTTLESRGAYF
jgi:hypothetical protein